VLPDGPYETVAGYMLAMLGHLPAERETVEVAGYRLTVTEMDGRRISRVLVSRLPTAAGPAAAPAAETGQVPGAAN
jgi:magnesium and cobalt exporter, CNNM family